MCHIAIVSFLELPSIVATDRAHFSFVIGDTDHVFWSSVSYSNCILKIRIIFQFIEKKLLISTSSHFVHLRWKNCPYYIFECAIRKSSGPHDWYLGRQCPHWQFSALPTMVMEETVFFIRLSSNSSDFLIFLFFHLIRQKCISLIFDTNHRCTRISFSSFFHLPKNLVFLNQNSIGFVVPKRSPSAR